MPLETVANLGDGLRLSVGRATPEVVAAVEALFRKAGNPKHRSLLEWQYLGRPGGAYIGVAHTGTEIVETAVAAYSAFPVPFSVGGVVGTAVQSFDTLTLPTHQGQGLFVRLATLVYELAAQSGELAVYGFPNDQSVYGFANRLGWTVFGQVPFLARPIGIRFALRKVGLRRSQVAAVHGGRGMSVEDFLATSVAACGGTAMASEQAVGLQLTEEYLNWRLRRPGASYRVHLGDGEGDGSPGLAITALADKHGASLAYLLWVDETADRRSTRQALRRGLGEVREAGADLCLAWVAEGDRRRRMLRRARFLNLPERLRPIELNFGFRPFRNDLAEEMGNPKDWRLSYLDSDTV